MAEPKLGIGLEDQVPAEQIGGVDVVAALVKRLQQPRDFGETLFAAREVAVVEARGADPGPGFRQRDGQVRVAGVAGEFLFGDAAAQAEVGQGGLAVAAGARQAAQVGIGVGQFQVVVAVAGLAVLQRQAVAQVVVHGGVGLLELAAFPGHVADPEFGLAEFEQVVVVVGLGFVQLPGLCQRLFEGGQRGFELALVEAHVADLFTRQEFAGRAAFTERGEITHGFVADRVEKFELADRLEFAAQVAKHETDQRLGLLATHLRFLFGLEGVKRQPHRHRRHRQRRHGHAGPGACLALGVAALEFIHADVEQAGGDLEHGVAAAVAGGRGVGGQRFVQQLALFVVQQSRREGALRRVNVGLTGDEIAEDPMAAARGAEMADFFVDPARGRRRRGADHHKGLGIIHRLADRVRQVVGRGQLILVAEHRIQPCRQVRLAGPQRGGWAIAFERALEPARGRRVGVAVADESAIAPRRGHAAPAPARKVSKAATCLASRSPSQVSHSQGLPLPVVMCSVYCRHFLQAIEATGPLLATNRSQSMSGRRPAKRATGQRQPAQSLHRRQRRQRAVVDADRVQAQALDFLQLRQRCQGGDLQRFDAVGVAGQAQRAQALQPLQESKVGRLAHVVQLQVDQCRQRCQCLQAGRRRRAAQVEVRQRTVAGQGRQRGDGAPLHVQALKPWHGAGGFEDFLGHLAVEPERAHLAKARQQLTPLAYQRALLAGGQVGLGDRERQSFAASVLPGVPDRDGREISLRTVVPVAVAGQFERGAQLLLHQQGFQGRPETFMHRFVHRCPLGCQKLEPGCERNSTSSAVDSRPRILLRCG